MRVAVKVDVEYKKGDHSCELDSDYECYGVAITTCYEGDDGRLWAGNGEYGSQVNFCPVCGFEAKVKVK